MQVHSFTPSVSLRTSRIFFIVLSLIALSFSSSYSQQLAPQSVQAPTELKGFQAEVLIPGAKSIIKTKLSDVPEVVRFKPGSEIPESEFKSWHHKNLKVSGDYDLKLLNEEKDSRPGNTHYRYQQTYKGVPIEGTMYIAHAKNGKVYSMTGQIFNKLNVNVNPSITESEALSKAEASVGTQKYAWEVPELEKLIKEAKDDSTATYFPKGELVLVANNGQFAENNFTLAYKFDIYSFQPYDRKEIFVDANDGHIVSSMSKVEESDIPATAHTVYSGTQPITCDYTNGVFSLQESGRGKGIITYNWFHHNFADGTTPDTLPSVYSIFTNTSTQWDANGVIDTATDAHWGAEMTYDYYKNTFNRNSLDGNGIKIINMMHEHHDLQNADWNGLYMEYGDGCGGVYPETDIGTIGHEMTHGVTQYTANLVYNGESGALNESFSDMAGVSVGFYATGNLTWDITDCGTREVRNMADPKSVAVTNVSSPQPDAYFGQYYVNTFACTGGDQCGVHTNSGVSNYWYYLISIGNSGNIDDNLSYPAYSVQPIGIQKAQVIAYTTLSKYLTPNSGFNDARVFSIQAAIDLYGEGSNEVIQVTNAWFAVGVGSPYSVNYLDTAAGTSSDGYSIAHDVYGNNYVAGSFSGTMTIGNFTLSGNDVSSAFVAKYDSVGNVLWAVAGGGAREADAAAITVDSSGNTYVAGTFTGGGVFNGTGGTSQNFPVGEVFDQGDDELEPVFDAVYLFVAKYDPNGKLLFCVSGGLTNINGGEVNNGYSGLVRAFAISCDDTSAYIGGLFDFGQTQFGNISLSNSTNPNAETSFLVKCVNGTFTWGTTINSTSDNKILSLSGSISKGWLFATGVLGGNSTYTESDGTQNSVTSPTGDHPFILSVLAGSGDMIFFTPVTGTGTGIGYSNTVSIRSGLLTVAGTGTGQLQFGTTSLNVTSGFVAGYSLSQSQFIWAQNTRGAAYGTTNDVYGNSYVTGADIVQEFNVSGNLLWSDTAFGSFQANSIITDYPTSVSITGFYSASFTYNTETVTGTGNQLFVIKIPIPSVEVRNFNRYTCISKPVNLQFVTTGNFYPGNVFTAQLSNTAGSFANPTILGSITSNSNTNTITFTLPGSVVIDSMYFIRVVSSSPYYAGVDPTTSPKGGFGNSVFPYFFTTPEANVKATITSGNSVKFCKGQPFTITAQPGHLYNFVWYRNGTQIISDTAHSITDTIPGTYKVMVFYDRSADIDNATCLDTALVSVKGSTININPSPVTIKCDSSFATLIASGADTYSWSPTLGLNVFSGASVQANPSFVTTYTVTFSAAGCNGDTTVVVQPKTGAGFSISPPAATIRCDSSLILNTVGSDTGYVWSPAKGLNMTSGPQVVASPSVTTTYTIVGTSASGCTSDTSIIVKVIKAPINVAPVTIRCDSSAALTAVGTYDNYSWSPAQGLDNTAGASVNASPTITTTYSVTGTSSSGCQGDTTVIVTVTKQTITVSPATITCDSSAILNAISKLTDFTWSPAKGLSSTSGTSVTANPTITSTYSVTATSSSGCSSDTMVVVTVKKLVFHIDPATISCDSSAMLTAIGSLTNYTWSPVGGLNSTQGVTVTANPTITTTYSVTGTTISGCSSDTSVVVTVKKITFSIPNATMPCDSSVTLNANGKFTSYTWSPSTGLSDSQGASVTANPTATTTYSVTGTTVSGCSSDTTVVVTVSIPVPVAIAGSGATSSSINANWNSAPNATAYLLDVANDTNFVSIVPGYGSLNVGNVATYKVTGLSSLTKYYYRVRAVTDCGMSLNSDTIAYSTLSPGGCAPPVLTIGGPTTFCQGGNVTLDAGTGWTTYLWSNQATTESISVTMMGSYSCAVTLGSCNKNSDTVTVGVTPSVIPSVSIIVSGSDSICSGVNAQFTATPVNGGTAPSYQWKLNGNNVGTNSPSYSNNSLANGDKVSVSMTSNATCAVPSTVTSNAITMIVNNTVTPSVSVSASPGATICSGTSVAFTASSTNGGTLPSYQWTLNGNDVGTNSSSYSNSSLANGDRVTAILTSNAACVTSATAEGNVITMIVNSAAPAAPVATAGSNATGSTITANWETATSATAYFIDVSISNTFSSFVSGYNNLNAGNVTSITVAGLSSGTTYYYRVRAKNGCGTSGNSNIISYSTTNCPSLSGIISSPDSSVICSGNTQVLSVDSVAGETYQWQISANDAAWSNVSSGGNSNNYTTSASDGISKKYYRCLISNNCYQASSSTAVVSISTTPVVTITGVTASTATITWTPYGSGQYNISWTGAGTGNAMAVTSNPYTITGLAPNQNLQVTVTPATPACSGANSGMANTLTLCASPTVTQAIASAAPSHAIIINWAAVSGAASYRVYYRDLFTNTSWSFADTTGTHKTIVVPLGGQTYAVYVAVKNCPSVGDIGAPSTIYYVTTNPSSACSPVPSVTAVSNCPNQITVGISGGTGPYVLTLREISPVISSGVTVTLSNTLLNVTIGSSYAGTVWEVFARASCGAGNSSNASNIEIVTVKPACPAVSNLVLSETTCSGFTASWNTNSCYGIGVTGYDLLIKKSGILNYTAYPVGDVTDKVVTFLTAGSTYNVAVLSIGCNGASSVYSLADTIAIPACNRVEENAEQKPSNPVSQQESVMVYPNPAQNQFFVDLGRTDMGETIVKIELINELGQVVETNLTQLSGGHLSQMINTPEGLSAGIYFVRTSVGCNVYVNKLMISRE